jgi:beta-mannosidase
VLEAEDPARPWIPASPSQGDVHQWDVWHGAAPWGSFSRLRAPFVSEFGLQALPHLQTVREMFPGGVPENIAGAAWAARKLQAAKLLHYIGLPADAELGSIIDASQRVQSAGIQAGIEACRLRREGSGNPYPCGGLAFWQFNEPWTAVTWSVIDRAGRPKAAYEMLLRSYQPLLVAARFPWQKWRAGERFRAELWMVNDGQETYDECKLAVWLDGERIWQSGKLSVPPASARRTGLLDFRFQTQPGELELRCERGGAVIAKNRYDLSVYLPPRQPLRSWILRRAADMLLKIG